jgi:hypothetical protein
MMLALIVVALWLLVVWVAFTRGDFTSDKFTAYATFGTTLVTLALAMATAFMAYETRRSRKLTEIAIEENRKLAEAPRIRELIIQVINPLLESVKEIKGYHERREYQWISQDLGKARRLLSSDQDVAPFQAGAGRAFLPDPWIKLEEHAANFCALNQTLYREFGRMQVSLITMIQEHDSKAESFRHLLADLAKEILSSVKEMVKGWHELTSEDELQKLTSFAAHFGFNKLLGASEKFIGKQEAYEPFLTEHGDSLVQQLSSSKNIKGKVAQIKREADSLAEELKKIEEELSQVKSGYREDYHLTYEEVEGQGKNTSTLIS